MLKFFRRHQKFFFVIVTFFIVISFTFFGTFGAVNGPQDRPAKEVGKLFNGKPLMDRELYGLLDLLQNGLEEGGRSVNLLSDSMIHRDILLSGIGEVIADHFFEKIQKDLASNWKRMKNYSSYIHPYAPFISARNTWEQFAPEINALLDEVAAAPAEMTRDQLPLFFKLYRAQADFPPHFLHQMLSYFQGQSEQIRPDPGLAGINLALFGFTSVEDWFGKTYVEELGKFILNAALIAKEEGYKIKSEEAHGELLSNVYRGLQAFSEGKNPSHEEVQDYFSKQVRALGLSEMAAIDMWNEVMHFRRFFHEVGESVFFDRLAFHQFNQFAKASHKICRYQLPQSLQFTDFREMLKFQRYLEATAKGDFYSLPSEYSLASEVLEKHPELVYKPFKVKKAQVSKMEIAAQIPLKQTWEWEGENFAQLKEEFPILQGCNPDTFDEKMAALDALDEMHRFQIDQYARSSLLEAHPEWIEEALSKAHQVEETLKVEKSDPLLSLLEKRDPTLSMYSMDQETFSCIEVAEESDWQLYSFEEANQLEKLDSLLDQLLEIAYDNMDFEQSYEEVQNHVAEKVYADLLKEIQERVGEKIEDLDSYAVHRFDGFLEEVRLQVVEGEESSLLETKEDYLAADQLALDVGEVSEVLGGGFFKLLERGQGDVTDQEIAKAKDFLKKDAQKALCRKILGDL